LADKVFRVYGENVDDLGYKAIHVGILLGNEWYLNLDFEPDDVGMFAYTVGTEMKSETLTEENKSVISEIDYRVQKDASYCDIYIESTDKITTLAGTEVPLSAFILNVSKYDSCTKVSILELNEQPGEDAEPAPEVKEDSNFLDDVATWFNDNLGVSFTSAGVVVAVIIFVILIKKK
jgi:hypothetical protein